MRSFINYVGQISLLLLLGSCNMDKDPIGLLTPDQVSDSPSEATFKSAVNSAYEPLRNTIGFIGDGKWDDGLFIRTDFVLEDIAGGDMNKKWVSDGDQSWMDDVSRFSFTTENPGFLGLWTYDYEGISRCNFAIDKVSNSQTVAQAGVDPALANRFLGEVLFLRAYYYFELVTNFGDVALLLKPLTSFNDAYEVSKRVPKEQIWQQIDADLSQAFSLVPDGKFAVAADPWRVSKGAILAMQAKVALYNEKWQEVLNKVQDLENTHSYQLNDNYFDNFSINKEYTDNEVIFSYNHTQGTLPQNGNGIGSLLGWGFLAPTNDFISEFEDNDPRLGYTVNVKDQLAYKFMGRLDAANRGNGDSPSNKVLIRWADVLLWKAEALIHTGAYPQAIQSINQVRRRARNTVTIEGTHAPATSLPDRSDNETDPKQITQWLIHERRVELGFETHRFSDLRRWKIAEETLKLLGKNFKSNNYLYPIPQTEIDLSGGSITQNEGY
ncbi:Starch-binding associating with outer membrane [bacterium A37T11]|nr:Starch-binding associating with outer membrane [bacterium A37T11]